MMSIKTAVQISLFAVGLVGMSAWAASTPPKPDASKESPAESKPLSPATGTPVYKPPVGRGVPGGRIGGGTRGGDLTFVLSALAPNHTGLTLQEQPIVYWYISKTMTSPLEFTLTDTGIKPLVEARLTPPFEPGIHALKLSDYGVKLSPAKRYKWFVSLVVDPERRSRDIRAGGTIERVESKDGLSTTLAQADPRRTPFIYAEAGLWYDAIEAISTLIQASPNDPILLKQRASLLEQGGL